MAKNLATDEDYIDMELDSVSKHRSTSSSSHQNREFEFQMSSYGGEDDAAVFPADELFYKGKLLPLHLPPRLQMVRNLLHTAAEDFEQDDDFYYTMPFLPACSTAPCTNSNTPLDSRNISPSESCRASCELNPDDYFFEWSAELRSFVHGNHRSRKKSWSKAFKLIKRYSVLGQKLRASRSYLKSIFTKSACSDDQSSAKESENSYKIPKKKAPTIANMIKNLDQRASDEHQVHRKSFSGTTKRHSFPAKRVFLSTSSNSSSTGSSSSSLNSSGFRDLQLSRRSSSVTEVECSIQAAIEHCKSSQKEKDSRNISFSASKICSI